MKSNVRKSVARRGRRLFTAFFLLPVSVISFSVWSVVAEAWQPLIPHTGLKDVNEGLVFEDITEFMEFDGATIVNPYDHPVVCMVGKLPFIGKNAKSPDLSGRVMRRGYKLLRKDKIPMISTGGHWLFEVKPDSKRKLMANTLKMLGTLQCAKVDRVVDRRCIPGMNIQWCKEQGLL